MLRPGASAALAAAVLAGVGPATQAAASSAPEQLAAQAAGVIGSGDQLALKLKGPTGERTLKIGELYDQGWTLQALTPSKAILAKDGAVREIGLNPGGVVVPADSAVPAIQVAVVGGDPVRRMVAAATGIADCLAEYRQKTGQDFSTLSDPALARPILGEARYAECEAFTKVTADTPEALRAGLQAMGDLNALRQMDGLPPLGPDRITGAAAKTYSDPDFPPGAFTLAGYSRGGILADGSFYMYRTPEALQAARAAGEEPPMAGSGMTPAESAAARDAWIAAHPNSSAR